MVFQNITGTTNTSVVINLVCSSAVGCSNLHFGGFNVRGPNGTDVFMCSNVQNVTGLNGV
ncbi:hypothetical protein AN958_05258 [Leucoagaricus sp. SymC.cos]|nr:hypothetical protein AN958_05258 [Leucoagaricus sp. SymC.cos]